MFYQYEITNNSNNRSLVISGEDTKELAEEKAKKSANYYVKECGYSVKVEIKEMCQSCYNQGRVKVYNKRNKLAWKMVRCPVCNGKFPVNTWIVEI